MPSAVGWPEPNACADHHIPHEHAQEAFAPALSVLAGKYLNVIRECGQPVVRPLPAGVHVTYDPTQPLAYQVRISERRVHWTCAPPPPSCLACARYASCTWARF